LQVPPSAILVVRGYRPVRAYWEGRSPIAPAEVPATAPLAGHPQYAVKECGQFGVSNLKQILPPRREVVSMKLLVLP
jgi:hypothetical protein